MRASRLGIVLVCLLWTAGCSGGDRHSRATDRDSKAAMLKVGEQDTGDDLWARALWLSLPYNEASSENVASLYVAALRRSKSRAPIYVSFGDTASGAGAVLERMDHLTQSLVDGAVDDFATAASQQLKEADPSPKRLKQSYENAPSNAVRSRKAQTEMDQLIGLLRDGSDDSTLHYLAALKEDQDYLPAWYRLAKHSTEGRRDIAIGEFIKRDSDNALAYYLRASAEIENGDLAAALAAVQQGNRARHCRTYPSPRPVQFKMVFPDTKMTQQYGVVGEAVSKSALDFQLDATEARFRFTDPIGSVLRNPCRAIITEGERMLAADGPEKALPWFEAVEQMGLQLIRIEPRDSLIIVTGVAIRTSGAAGLASVYKALGDNPNLERLQGLDAKDGKHRADILAALQSEEPTDESIRAILQGKAEFGVKTRELLDQALIDLGLLDESFVRSK